MSIPYGNPNGPYNEAAAVVKSDSTVLTATRALWVGGVGDVVVDMAMTGTNITFTAVPAGTLLKIAVTKVKAATSATLIVALW